MPNVLTTDSEEQALLVAAPKVDIVKQREPAEAKIAHGDIDRAMQIAKGFSTLTVRRKAREIIKAAAVFYPVRHRRRKLVREETARPGLSGERHDYQDELRTIRNNLRLEWIAYDTLSAGKVS